ncbi:hypothetical protein HYV57_04620 [Candidatus Peregrinibacteria bacterium]|nr:hypothetical protein [Candidatus Peregrinibacteria bacterium]
MIQKRSKNRKKYRNRIVCGIILTAFFMIQMPMPVYADYKSERNKFVAEASSKLSIGMEVINLLLWPILILSGELLDSSVIFDADICEYDKPESGTTENITCKQKVGTMEDQLLKIWVQIRNIVNVVFVVLLLFVALYNVLGKTEGEFVLKSMLPRIVIGLVAVNFSFLAAKVVLDVTNVLTTSLVALPISLSEPMNQLETEIANSLCTYQGQPISDKRQIKEWGLEGICATNGQLDSNFKTSFLSDYSHKNLAFVLAAQIARLGDLKYVSTELKKHSEDTDISDPYFRLFLELLSNVLIIALYVVSILAFFIVLVFRVVILWVLIAVSPLLVLFLVIPQLAQGAEEFDFKKLFIQHAIAPILMVGSLSIGYVILESMVGNTTVILKNEYLNSGTSFFSQIFPTYSMMGQFLATIAGLVVIWMGVFGAASKTTASVVTDKLRDTTKAFGSWLATTPLYWIRIPVTQMHGAHDGGEEKKVEVSLGQLGTILPAMGPGLASERRQEAYKKGQELGLPGMGSSGVAWADIDRDVDSNNRSSVQLGLKQQLNIKVESSDLARAKKALAYLINDQALKTNIVRINNVAELGILMSQNAQKFATALGTTAEEVINMAAAQKTVPAAGTTAPAAGTTAPAAGTTAPAAGITAPAAGITAPAAGTTAPAAGTTAPAAGITAPAAGTTAPAAGTTAPAAAP